MEDAQAAMETKATLESYKASGRTTLLALILMPATGLAGAFICSYVYFVASYFILIPILFPYILGRATGIAINIGALLGKNRNEYIALIPTLILPVVAYVLTFHWEYQRFHKMALSEAHTLRRGPTFSDVEVERLVEAYIEKETGYSGLFGYILFESGEFSLSSITVGGITLNSVSGIKLPAWIGRLLAIIGFFAAIWGGISQSSRVMPFCEKDKRFLDRKVICRANSDFAEEIADALLMLDLAALPALYQPSDGKTAVTLEADTCPACRSGYLHIGVLEDKKEEHAFTIKIDPAQLDALEQFEAEVQRVTEAANVDEPKEN